MQLPKITESSLVYNNFFKIKEDILLLENKTLYSYYSLVLRPMAVMIIAITKNEELVLTEEYRHPTKEVLLGCPGGVVEKDEDPLTAAKRELLEETGYTSEEFEVLGTSYPLPGVTGQMITFVRAKNAFQIAYPQLDEAEILRPVLKTEAAVKQALIEGSPIDGLLLTALFFHQTKTS